MCNTNNHVQDFILFLVTDALLEKKRYMLIHDSEKRHVKVKLNEEHTFTYDLITAEEYNAKAFAKGVLSPDSA